MSELTAPAAQLSTLFELEGTPRVVAGNHPLPLMEPDAVWMVAGGHVEVFSIDAADEASRRYHFFTANPGDLLMGVDSARSASGLGLMAIGVVGARVLRIDRAHFQAWASDPALRGELADLLDRWVVGMSAGVSRRVSLRPRADHMIDGGELQATAAQRVRSSRGVRWVRQIAGSSLFAGLEEVPEPASDTYVPLTPVTWIQTLEPTTVAAFPTADVLDQAALWRGVDAFSDIALRCEYFNIRLGAVDELNRLKERARRVQRIRAGALLDLATVMSVRPETASLSEAHDALLAACLLVGSRAGIRIQPPPRLREGDRSTDLLGDIVRASRIRAREVRLSGKWYRKDAGPLLGYRGAEKAPVALLPVSTRAYEVVDPLTHDRRRITRRNAAEIQPTACSFYRPFPNQSLAPANLLRFAVGSVRTSDILVTLGVGLFSGLLALLTPSLSGVLIDDVIPQAARGRLAQLAIILGVAGVGAVVLDTIQALTIQRIETLLQSSVQPALWDRLLGLHASFFRRFTAGDLAQRVQAADQLRQSLSGGTVATLMSGVFSIALFAQMFYFNAAMAFLVTAIVLVAAGASLWAGLRKVRAQRVLFALEGKIAGLVLQLLTGIPKLRVAGAEGRAYAMWGREFAAKARVTFATARVDKWFAVFTGTIPVIASLAIFKGFGGLASAAESQDTAAITTGGFVAFNAAATLFLTRVLAVASALITIVMTKPLFERARPVLEALPESDDTKLDPGELTGAIQVSRASFRYQADAPLVLDDVSLRIEPGECVAIVGPSGSGKSTILRLLLGLDRPEKGTVYFDGKDIAMLDPRAVRRRIGVVMQNNKIRAGSIFQNIVGASTLTIDDAWEAARMAGFETDLQQMPMGMHTILQQGGGTLSGGQRQRLLIARAIATRPRILFFDEATSALDNRTQAIVTESLHRLQATRVIIAHRLSTIVGADRIYVVSAGRIVETGTYAELAAAGGVFSELIKRQVA